MHWHFVAVVLMQSGVSLETVQFHFLIKICSTFFCVASKSTCWWGYHVFMHKGIHTMHSNTAYIIQLCDTWSSIINYNYNSAVMMYRVKLWWHVDSNYRVHYYNIIIYTVLNIQYCNTRWKSNITNKGDLITKMSNWSSENYYFFQ